MKKHLALFLDGTWNDPSDRTNVHTLYELTLDGAVDGVEQRRFYQRGVGVGRWERLRGGALGKGLVENVEAAYSFLAANFSDGDDVFVFGFSRGAYTARSVAGLVAKCGLLTAPTDSDLRRLFDRHREGKLRRSFSQVEFSSAQPGTKLDADDQWLLQRSRRVPIHMLGVWDTVGALGIPWTAAPFVGRQNYYFLSTNPSTLVKNSYHAVAIDENRGAYKATMWTDFVPDGEAIPTRGAPPAPDCYIEQRWFCGAHCNVGGGYSNNSLSRIPLAWMQAKASQHGLRFSRTVTVDQSDYSQPVVDSFSAFVGGVYKLLKFGRRHHRPIGAPARKVEGGASIAIGEVIDESVFHRLQDALYNAPNLRDFLTTRRVDVASHQGDYAI